MCGNGRSYVSGKAVTSCYSLDRRQLHTCSALSRTGWVLSQLLSTFENRGFQVCLQPMKAVTHIICIFAHT